jgi:hypothetical protein
MAEPKPKRLVAPYLDRTAIGLQYGPMSLTATQWRQVVRVLPAAINCRDVLISRVTALPWRVVSRDSKDQERYQSECDEYEVIFNNWNGEGFNVGLTKMLEDALDLPIGGNVETLRWPDGKLHSIWNIDGATLNATGNPKMPLWQRLPVTLDSPTVYLSDQEVKRIGFDPRPEFDRQGWFMAPPEKVYVAIQLLYRGDQYYWQLLQDTPPAGLLSLGDMSESAAKSWIASFRELMTGLSPMKIPVLYEIKETQPAWIPFGKPPSELMYDQSMLRYLQFLCAGYGIAPQDIAIGDDRTLAGTIRNDRASRQTGFALVRDKVEVFCNSLLPPYLRWQTEEHDEESQIMTGRARLANMQAFEYAIRGGFMKPEDIQNQLRADALVTVSFTGLPDAPVNPGRTQLQPNTTDVLQTSKPVAQGGRGEITKAMPPARDADEVYAEEEFGSLFDPLDASDVHWRKLVRSGAKGQDLAAVLKKDPWWKTTLKAGTAAGILAAIFVSGWKQSANDMQSALYEEGLAETPYLTTGFNFLASGLMDHMGEYAASMVARIDDGTRFYLNQIITRSVKEGLEAPDIAGRIATGESIDSILKDAGFLQGMVDKAKAEISKMTPERIKSIAHYETRHALNWAWQETLARSGLTRKAWAWMGPERRDGSPCTICQENEALGFVPMSFMFKTVFEDSPHPPAHPHICYCTLMFDRDELVAKANQIHIWTGE